MASAIRTERTDAPGEADEGRVPGRDVAHAYLGLRHIEQREPTRVPQLDEGDDEREREDRQ
jgi:hypothetical protein